MAIQIHPYTEGGPVSFPRRDLAKALPIGKWTVLSFAGRTDRGRAYWLCRCACGTERPVIQDALLGGVAYSCGCANRKRNTKHGMGKTPECKAWRSMRKRCCDPTSPKYHNYGGRGIAVCDRWRDSFPAFYADMGPRPSPKHQIDRFPDNNGNYEPGNCRWATGKQNCNNKRTNRIEEYKGEFHTVTEWADRLGFPIKTLRHRLSCGWALKDALETPIKEVGKRWAYKGMRKTVRQLAGITGVPYWAIVQRLRRGWSIQDAIERPLRKCKTQRVEEDAHSR